MANKISSMFSASRLLIASLLVVIVVLGFALVIQTIGKAGQPSEVGQVNVLENSDDACVTCHRAGGSAPFEKFTASQNSL